MEASCTILSVSDAIELTHELCERLTPRQRECLRHVYRLRTSKEIALELGLGVGTVDTYISEAVAILRARNRRHAAELFHNFEDDPASPRKMEGEYTGVGRGRPDESPEKAENPARSWARLLPLRTMGVSANDLSPYLRYFWLVLIAIALATGFGMLAVGLEVLSRFLG
ncbi:response regulator transcription factor [Sphingopyxis sp. 22461]|uniref:response regulator transcription factor n=1 Tax=Sphingopyxis sp. 22461 TaxID=3453923 RepID=UPI003F861292